MKEYDVVIIGSGPAGMSAALYLKRANISCCVIEGSAPGGQMNKTATIENYPGLEKVTGPELSMQMWRQVTALKTDYLYTQVVDIEKQEERAVVHTKIEDILCKYVIIASGRSPRKLGVPGEEKLTGRGVSYCAVCDGPLYKDKEVAVIGGSDAALEEALYLASICKTVYLVHRRDSFRAKASIVDEVLKRENIIIYYDSVVTSFNEEENKLESITISNRKDNHEINCKVKGAFIFIGHEPNTAFAKSLSIVNEKGYIPVNHHFESAVSGIYAVGDVIEKDIFQIVTAASEGTTAALTIASRLTKGDKNV